MSQAVDPTGRRARALSAISLGAAFALFAVVFLGYDAPASQAAGGGGGLLEAVFGGTHGPETYYDGYPLRFRVSPAPGRFSASHHARRHDIQARRRVAERRRRPARRAAPPEEQTRQGETASIHIISPSRNAVFQMPATQPAPIQQLGAPTPVKSRPAGCAKPCFPQPQLMPQSSAGLAANALYADRTLRPGDTVVTAEGLRILRAGSRFPFKAADFQSLAEAGRMLMSYKSALGEIERALKTPDRR